MRARRPERVVTRRHCDLQPRVRSRDRRVHPPGAADDYILPGFIEKAMAQFDRHPQAGVCVALRLVHRRRRRPADRERPGLVRPADVLHAPTNCVGASWHTLPVSAIIVPPRRATGGRRLPSRTRVVLGLVRVPRGRVPARSDPHSRDARRPRAASRTRTRRTPAPATENVRILGALLDLLTSPEYADVAPYFRRNGAACHFGPDLIRAAAQRPDRFEPQRARLPHRLHAGACTKQLANDPIPAFANSPQSSSGSRGVELIARRADLEAENRRLVEEIQLTRLRARRPGRMGNSAGPRGCYDRRLRKAVGLHPAGRFR